MTRIDFPGKLLLSIIVLLPFCSHPQTETISASPGNSAWQNRALFLAGMPTDEEFAARPDIQRIQASPEYAKHARQMEEYWQSVKMHRTTRIQNWRESELDQRLKGHEADTVFYPLSGADFLNVSLLFPHAKRYIMMAMEKPGSLRDPAEITATELRQGYHSVEKMLNNITQTGYFFSKWMNAYLQPERMGYYGTLPTVSVFLVRLGHRIDDVQNICLDSKARIGSGPDCVIPGYRIWFTDGRDGIQKQIVYLSAEIDEKIFSENSPLADFLVEQKQFDVMMKAAIYLFHLRKYAVGRDFLLRNGDVIVQDDSGIPFRYFSDTDWDLELYGDYRAPLRGLGIGVQQDMAKAFREKAHPLPFEYGYGNQTAARKSGLMVAIRRNRG
ncbi:MAG: hypothetical protein KDK37_00540 [Leptospiraceae bacterium]|nr:hypothetical protein [Leptospiraceae bacterium]MCB1302730.1 hypothetical protein [Leptospiraceae bacterium]